MSTSNVIILFSILFLLSPKAVLAAKQRVWANTSSTTTAKIYKPSFSVKFNSGRKGLIVKFSDLNTASPVTYELTYSTNGLEQGVVGAISLSEGKTATRELLFGTCSKNVCTYHKNITGAQLKITSKLKTDKTYIKTYKIKI